MKYFKMIFSAQKNMHKVPNISLMLLALACLGLHSNIYAQNYSYSKYYTQPHQSESTSDILEDRTYFDELGRSTQSVSLNQSPSGKNIIGNRTYSLDQTEVKSYMSYTSSAGATSYDHDWESHVDNFYGDDAEANGVAYEDTYYYQQTNFVPDELRTQVWGTGSAWSTKYTEQYAYVNEKVEVRTWSIEEGVPDQGSYYAAGSLLKNISIDIEGVESHVFVDNDGNQVLKRIVTASSTLDTYYVYDDHGNLRFIIPPKAVEEGVSNAESNVVAGVGENLEVDYEVPTSIDHKIYKADPNHAVVLLPGFSYKASNTGQGSFVAKIESTFISDLIFEYQYDDRDRLVSKKEPGASWVYYVYDQWDRPVLSQDGNQRIDKEWSFVKYDRYDRVIMSGVAMDSRSQSDIQTMLDETTSFLAFELRDDSEAHNYTENRCYPNGTNSQSDGYVEEVLSYTYYDTYPTDLGVSEASVTGYVSTDDMLKMAFGLTTASKVKKLNSSEYIPTLVKYDKKYNIIQTVTGNHLGGYDRQSSTYTFDGHLSSTHLYHETTYGVHTVEERFVRDDVGRLLAHYHRLDGGVELQLANYFYNELGQVASKQVLEKAHLNYQYNIKGWLKSINENEGGGLFEMKIEYEDAPAPKFNGLPGKVRWSTYFGTTDCEQSYNYSYNDRNQLESAVYSSCEANDYFNLSGLTYDANGNIKTLNRKYNGADQDLLTYQYEGNQLSIVEDAVSDNTGGFVDGNTSGYDYSYDLNGNLTLDSNKGIKEITYNDLDLPELIEFSTGEYVSYTYDASGVKLTTEVYNGTTSSTTDYVGGFEYLDGVLQLVHHAEGRYNFLSTHYEFDIKDHQGNTRGTWTRSINGESFHVLQTQDYYPFGLTFNFVKAAYAVSENQYLYQGQERQIDKVGLDMYQLRSYDPAIGRWTGMDPYNQFASPYLAMGNTPHIGVDPDGGFFWGTLAEAAFGGAISGAQTAHENGTDPLKGAIYGAGYGALSSGIGMFSAALTSQVSNAGVRTMLNAGVSTVLGSGVQGINGIASLESIALNFGQSYVSAQSTELKYDHAVANSYEYRLKRSGVVVLDDAYITVNTRNRHRGVTYTSKLPENWGNMDYYLNPIVRSATDAMNAAGAVLNTVAQVLIPVPKIGLVGKLFKAGRAAKASTTVGRWMSKGELAAMRNGSSVLEGAGGQTFVTKGGSHLFSSAPKGSVYVEFGVPTNSLLQGGKSGWFKLIGPNASKSQQFLLQKQGGSLLPSYQNLSPILKVK